MKGYFRQHIYLRRLQLGWLIGLILLFTACGYQVDQSVYRAADSLNTQAYRLRYKDLDSAEAVAGEAYRLSQSFPSLRAEALNHLGSCAFLRMDFERAESLFQQVLRESPNEVECLVADVCLMKICQRTALYKEFYDYRNSALRRMRRIQEDRVFWDDPRWQLRMQYAESEFSIASAVFYYYLQQKEQSLAAIDEVVENEALERDTAQLLYYYYMRGSGGMYQAPTPDEVVLGEFNYLVECLSISQEAGYTYFQANALQAMAELLKDRKNYDLLLQRRSFLMRALNGWNLPWEEWILYLAQSALDLFKEYGDWYQISGTYRTLASCCNELGRHEEALDYLTKALEYVNLHHEKYYHCPDTADRLKPYVPLALTSIELEWIKAEGIKSVPEWIARFREQLSVTYAALGLKPQSDYNRNIYLDLLDYTRQDKELESRYVALEAESEVLNRWLFAVIVGFFVLVFVGIFWNRRWRKHNALYIEKLKCTLEVCRRITAAVPTDASETDDVIEAILLAVKKDILELVGATDLQIQFEGGQDEDAGLLSSEAEESLEGGERANCCLPRRNSTVVTAAEAGFCTRFALLLPGQARPLGQVCLYTTHRLRKEDEALMQVFLPYLSWTIENGLTFVSLAGRRKQLEKEQYIHEQHVVEHKRQNLVKKACLFLVTGITPYIDRIINEVHKLRVNPAWQEETIRQEKYHYISELVTRINEYNDILALWIQMRKGTLSLTIESFPLQSLLDVLQKGRKTFEAKRQTLTVVPTEVWLKADKALTLFMIHTLAENARKYTQEGGRISVFAQETEAYVEISVQDNGPGLSAEEVRCILGEKVYDSGQIGLQTASDVHALLQNKGHGFGLMNCKGIIEQYRKINERFRVCLFQIESTPGKGSRFYFRLPKGVRKVWAGIGLVCTLSGSFSACSSDVTVSSDSLVADAAVELPLSAGVNGCASAADSLQAPLIDTLETVALDYRSLLQLEVRDSLMGEGKAGADSLRRYDRWLAVANAFSYEVYRCNVEGNFRQALVYADSAFQCLNHHFCRYAHRKGPLLALEGEGAAAELTWFERGFETDYFVLLDVRNEAAVAFLALDSLAAYRYNNAAYTALYKQVGEDRSLEDYCRRMQLSANNKTVAIILCGGLLVVFIVGYYLLNFRYRLMYRYNLEQVLEMNRKVFLTSLQEPHTPLSLVDRLAQELFDSINELLPIDRLGMAIFSEETQGLQVAIHPLGDDEEELREHMSRCFEMKQPLWRVHDRFKCLPLWAETGGEKRCTGVLALQVALPTGREDDRLMLELVANYVGIIVYHAVILKARKFRDLEMAQDEARRTLREENQLHVQNLVLDNCLSTIKHETIYYPNRIKQIIDRLPLCASAEEAAEQLETIDELISYYKGIFTLLSSCAARQLEEVTFRRRNVQAVDLGNYALRYFQRIVKRLPYRVTLDVQAGTETVIGDEIQLKYLVENLLNEALAYPADGCLVWSVRRQGAFVRFDFCDTRRNPSMEELNQLFYPQLSRMQEGGQGMGAGTEYLICKQIIRDHDEYVGRRGCRINAEPAPGGGFTVWFTLPAR